MKLTRSSWVLLACCWEYSWSISPTGIRQSLPAAGRNSGRTEVWSYLGGLVQDPLYIEMPFGLTTTTVLALVTDAYGEFFVEVKACGGRGHFHVP